jgi:hypothetical protein
LAASHAPASRRTASRYAVAWHGPLPGTFRSARRSTRSRRTPDCVSWAYESIRDR